MYSGTVQLSIEVHDKEMRDVVWSALQLFVDTVTSPNDEFQLSKVDMNLSCQESEDFARSKGVRFPTN